MSKTRKKSPTAKELIKLDIGSRPKQDGFTRLENPLQFPWPFDDASVSEAACLYYFGYVPGKQRGKFMDELYRVMVPNAKCTMIIPYWSSIRGVQDFLYEWPPVVESSFLYFNKGWREAQQITNYPTKADFDFTYGYNVDADTAARNEETRAFWVKHYTNAIMDLQIVLTRRP